MNADNTTHFCPIDCVWDDWSAWGDCSHSCGNGTMPRTRTKLVPEQYGGVQCSGCTSEQNCPGNTSYMHCNDELCPVDCTWEDWSEWGDCTKSCGEGTTTRERGIANQKSNGGWDCFPLLDTGVSKQS